ncbi:DUF6351 family protein [Noviherbaspirillum pedocola]|uniref:DUF6351 domain-containing protein n=1 Tax=Noviherbaspirillum pedocola TaxID=2801341 RepID=A0A934T2K3_9BURK|nr:DUF6351 family protein [Noviherbaspirillum pedocola]MBK4738347.1 hypothetical protein [Noviherbaspirillum pedocola]
MRFPLAALAGRAASASFTILLAATGASALALTAPASAASAASAAAERDSVSLQVLSSKPEYVSGGSALIKATLPPGIAKQGFTIMAGRNDVTSAFTAVGDGEYIGLVKGLTEGANTIVLTPSTGRGLTTSLTVTNYPISGPMFSGPPIQPFICQTGSLSLPDGSKLQTTPNDPNCSAATNVQFVYRSTKGSFVALRDPKSLPADLAMITKPSGEKVPYIVRVETTTIDRGVSQMTMLFDPSRDAEPSPTARPRNWNGRLVYGHGTGCVGGWYISGAGFGYSPLNDTWLSRGYAVATNTLNHPTNSCNPVVAGEVTSMTKEYFIKRYGVPAYTMTVGTSGGAYTSLQVADAFPGLFDGVFIDATFPDALAIAMSGMDAHLLSNYFLGASASAASFTPAQQAAVSGYANTMALVANGNQMGRTDPVPGRLAPTYPGIANYNPAVFNAAVPASLRYNPNGPTPNFAGARPTVFDENVNVYGRAKNPLDPSQSSTYALRPFDNAGVQYGLAALNAGRITTTQFLDLNESVGGFDTDANPVPTRSIGNTSAMRRVYQAGVMLSGGGGLASLPIMDTTAIYGENNSNYHMQWEHFAVRARLVEANGNADNQVMWRGGPVSAPVSTGTPLAIATFEQWMEKILADTGPGSARDKVLRDKPSAAVDGCFDASMRFIPETQTLGVNNSTCNTMFPSYSNARIQAGGPLAANVFKCELKAISAADYQVAFTPAEMARLRRIFPSGTCDWSKPGVSQTRLVPWPSVGPSPVHQIFDVNAVQ